MTVYWNTPLTVGVILIICMVGLLFATMFFNSTTKDKGKKKVHLDVVDLKNVSSEPQIVKTIGKVIKMEPGETSKITLPSNAVLETENRKIELPEERINTVYITGSNISTNLSAKTGYFVNSSSVAVELFEVGNDGKIWSKGFIGPGNQIPLLIPAGTLWRVADTERRNTVLGSVKTTLGTRELVYNGESLLEAK